MTTVTKFDRWRRWDKANPEFYAAWKDYAQEALQAGVPKISGWLLANRIRWDCDIQTKGDAFKVPNDFIAYFVRLWIAEHPNHARFFECRPLKTAISDEAIAEHLLDRVTV
ncbi:hypothetical protein KIKIMORA_04280 [Brevundimonas phage vB_BpoS-Kikimora]|uniref:Uncharacterized protein n=1 Tax=Brevundimonas phage vB_BpoS-Kikimora TaxID=2948601 RepID=A0A9E7MTU1_9CAUD|nr:hypothetical protein KIKIMORA_04280 [Brevundimonas phage vB_BpoS-Kikimora]